MISASDFLKGNTAKSGSSTNKFVSASEFLKSQPAPVQEENKPTIGGQIVRGIVKTPARLATNLINAGEIAVGKKPTTPFSGNYLGEVKPVGQSGNFFKDVQDSLGVGLEAASYLPIVRGASTLANLAREGATAGFLGSAGSEISKNAITGEKISSKNIALSTGGGAILGPILGAGVKGLQRVFGKNIPKVVEKAPEINPEPVVQTPLTPMEKLANYSKSQGYEPYTPNANLPTIDYGTKAKSSIPEIQIGEASPKASKVPGDFTYQPVKNEVPLPQNIPAKITEDVKVLNKAKPEQVVSGTHESYAKAFEEDLATNPQLVEDIAMGKKAHPKGVPSDAYLSLLSNEAERTGNADLIDKLSNSKVLSQSGTKLEAGKLKTKNNIVDIVRDIKDSFKEQLPKSVNEKKQVSEFTTKLKEALDGVVGTKPTREAILSAVDSLICK